MALPARWSCMQRVGTLDCWSWRISHARAFGCLPRQIWTPPTDTTLAPSPSEGGWVDVSVVVNQLEHGAPERAERFVLHVTGEFGPLHPRTVTGHPSFELGGWQVALDDLPEHGVRDFACAAQGIPRLSSTGESVRTTAQRLAMLLSLTAGTEIGIGPNREHHRLR